MVSQIQTIPSQNLTYGRLLGEGSFGKVYEGTWQQSAVAIKQFINQQLTEQAQEEIENEQNIMASMRHPHIITFYGVCPNPLSFVMELMPASLYQVLHSRQDLPWKLRYQISGDIANGLWFLHEEKNLIHRDLKSLNVLLDDKLRARITDFGLARVKTESKTQPYMKTKDRGMGTLQWMAPELFSLRPKYSKSADIFGYAVILWEIASRNIPYQGVDDITIREEIKNGEREERSPDCPQRFWQLITDCWKQDPEQRPRIVQVQARCVELLQEESQIVEEQVKTRFQSPPVPLKQSSQVPMETRPLQVIAQLKQQVIQPQITAPQSAIPSMAFGRAEWAKYFGDVGAEPPLPANIMEILNSQCTFWPDRQVKDTHLLVLVPNTVNKKPFNLNLLSEMIQGPKAGYKTQYRYYSDHVKNELGNKTFPSHWVLLTHDVIPDSRNQTYDNQKKLVQRHAQQSAIPYELPTGLETTTAILMEHVKTGKRLYSDSPATWTRCLEKVNNNQWPVDIGGFSSGGLDVDGYWGGGLHGVGCCRKF